MPVGQSVCYLVALCVCGESLDTHLQWITAQMSQNISNLFFQIWITIGEILAISNFTVYELMCGN